MIPADNNGGTPERLLNVDWLALGPCGLEQPPLPEHGDDLLAVAVTVEVGTERIALDDDRRDSDRGRDLGRAAWPVDDNDDDR